MTAIAIRPAHDVTSDPKLAALIRRTIAADATNDEFDVFISTARALGLNPLRKQIYCLVYSKDDPKKRRMSIIVGIDGYRAVAARSGAYRADDRAPRYTYQEGLKSPLNPHGIESCEVSVWKFSHDSWYPETAVAYWDEFAPVTEEWAWDEASHRRKPTGEKKLEGRWASMGRHMLAKCAESLALRRGWPELSGTYSEEEMEKANYLELTATELVEQAGREEREAKIGGPGQLYVQWHPAEPISGVKLGEFADRAMQFIEEHPPSAVAVWADANREPLKAFWAHSKADALEIRKAIEAKTGAAP